MSKIPLSVKAVILDMDGVITNTMPDHYRAWRVIFREAALTVSRQEVYRREGQPGLNTVLEISAAQGCLVNPEEARRLLARKERLFKKIVRRRFIPGARHCLYGLKSQGFILALVTGTARHEVRRILPKKLLDLFSVTVTGDEVKNGKPHPEPYLMALKKLGLKAREAIVIENAPFGIRSAKHAGLQCLALETSLPKKYLTGADFIFPSWRGLTAKIAFLSPS